MANGNIFTDDGSEANMYKVARGQVTRIIAAVAAGSSTTAALNDLADLLLANSNPGAKRSIPHGDRPTSRQDVIDALATL